MAVKTRYLQISDIIMFEYNMLGENDVCKVESPSSFIFTKLRNNHKLLFSPVSYECETEIDETDEVKYKKRFNPLSLNTLNHLAVPKEKDESVYYYFIDDDYKYVSDDIMNQPSTSNRKAYEYAKYLTYPIDGEGEAFDRYYDNVPNVRWDNMKLYFVNGYDFSNIYGLLVRISVDRNSTTQTNNDYIDLCDFLITRNNAYSLIKYLANPIIFGDNIYDRYIEINVPCLYDLIKGSEDDFSEMFDDLDIKPGSPIKLSFSYILSDDKDVESLDYTISDLTSMGNYYPENVNCSFVKSSNLKGNIPSENINSDNLGCYIAECEDMPYLEFYGTWRNNPLNSETVWKFNKGIRLYDNSLVKRDSVYEVDDDYEVKYDMRKWVAMHEIKCSFCNDDIVVKEETYNMSQIFTSVDDPTTFYYRPLIFDESAGLQINNIQIVYTMRFINVNDKVQFVKTATLSLIGDMMKYYAKGTSLKSSQMHKYFVYNKIVDNKQEILNGGSVAPTVKYIKSFYDTANIVLRDNDSEYGTYNFTLNMSQAPKSYKFTFKKAMDNGNYDFIDLTNGYYKILFKDAGNNDVTIEPTYSKNMNLYLGELEFNVPTSIINKLMSVEEGSRKMSIIAYNEDGSVSSMFDFTYNI